MHNIQPDWGCVLVWFLYVPYCSGISWMIKQCFI
jgi:hypothetical protein